MDREALMLAWTLADAATRRFIETAYTAPCVPSRHRYHEGDHEPMHFDLSGRRVRPDFGKSRTLDDGSIPFVYTDCGRRFSRALHLDELDALCKFLPNRIG